MESQIRGLFSHYENWANFYKNQQKSSENTLKMLPNTPEDVVPSKLRTSLNKLFATNFEGDPLVLMNTIRQENGSESIDGYSELLETLDEKDSDDDDDADAEILNSTINKLDQKIAENEEFFKKLEILIPLAQKVRKRNEENLDFKTVASDLQLLKSETGKMLENHQNWRNIGPQYLENMNSSCNFEVSKTNETVQKILEKMMEKETGEGELEILKKSLNEEIDLLISEWKEDLDMPEILMDDDKPELTEKINNLSPGIRELVNHLNFLWQIEKQFLKLFEDDFFGKNELIEKYITMLSLDEEDKNLDLERKILEKSQKSENPEKWKKLKNAIENLKKSIIQETDNLISDCSERSESSGIFETLRKSQKELFETFDYGCSIQMMHNFMNYLENAFSFISENHDGDSEDVDGDSDSEELNDYMEHVFKSLGIEKNSGDSEDVENAELEILDCENLEIPEVIEKPASLKSLHKKAVPQNPDSTDYVGNNGPGEFDEFMKKGQFQGKNQYEWIQFVLSFIGAITVLSIPIYLIFSICLIF